MPRQLQEEDCPRAVGWNRVRVTAGTRSRDGLHRRSRGPAHPRPALGRQQHQADPEQVGEQQVHDLHPHRRQERDVDEPGGQLRIATATSATPRGRAAVGTWRRRPRADQHQAGRDEDGDGRMQQPEPHEDVPRRRTARRRAPRSATAPGRACRRARPRPRSRPPGSCRPPRRRTAERALRPATRVIGPPRPESHLGRQRETAIRANVLTRCTDMNSARAMLGCRPPAGRGRAPAPTAASVTMKKIDQAAARRARVPCRARAATSTRAARRPPGAPGRWSARCENSTSISTLGARGMTSPLQSGQCAPQPAPDRVART